MSAFMVEDKTINRILCQLDERDDRTYELPKILDAAGIERDATDWKARLGQSMAMMNRDAVNERYSENELPEPFIPRMVIPHKIQAVKSLACWLYQCSEGDVPERELYKAFVRLKGEWSYDIVQAMPTYDKLEWA